MAWWVMRALIVLWSYTWVASAFALAYRSRLVLATLRIALGVAALFDVWNIVHVQSGKSRSGWFI
jgi:hypothetical protein